MRSGGAELQLLVAVIIAGGRQMSSGGADLHLLVAMMTAGGLQMSSGGADLQLHGQGLVTLLLSKRSRLLEVPHVFLGLVVANAISG